MLKLLYEHNWPGNIRGFENYIEYMVNFEQQEYITPQSVPQRLLKPEEKACPQACDSAVMEDTEGKTLKQLTQDFERNVLKTITLRPAGQGHRSSSSAASAMNWASASQLITGKTKNRFIRFDNLLILRSDFIKYGKTTSQFDRAHIKSAPLDGVIFALHK